MIHPRSMTFASPILIGVIGLSVFLALPVFVGGLVDGRGLSDTEAGWVSSAEMGGLALGNVAFLLLARRLSLRTFALAALLVFAVGNAAMLLAQSFDAIVAVRCVSGIGGGAGFALATAALSRSPDTDRAFSIFLVWQLGFQAVALWLGPMSLQLVPVDALYLLVAGVALASIAFVRALPSAEGVENASSTVESGNAARAPAVPLIMALAAITLLFAATGGVWTYLERMGATASLQPHEIGLALGASGIAGIAGPSTTLWLTRHAWRRTALIGFTAVLVAAQLLLMKPASFALYALAACAFNFGWNALIPYYYGLLAEMDASGRAAVAGNLLATIGLSAGAAVAATLSRGTGHGPLLSAASLACIASLALLLPLVNRGRSTVRRIDVAAR